MAAVAATSVRAASLRRLTGVLGSAWPRIEARHSLMAATTTSGESETSTFWWVVSVTTVSGVESMATIRSGLR